MNRCLARNSLVPALGGLLFGFDTAVIAGATGALTAAYGLTPRTLGVTVAAALWGAILGAMFGGIPGDRYGFQPQPAKAALRLHGLNGGETMCDSLHRSHEAYARIDVLAIAPCTASDHLSAHAGVEFDVRSAVMDRHR